MRVRFCVTTVAHFNGDRKQTPKLHLFRNPGGRLRSCWFLTKWSTFEHMPLTLLLLFNSRPPSSLGAPRLRPMNNIKNSSPELKGNLFLAKCTCLFTYVLMANLLLVICNLNYLQLNCFHVNELGFLGIVKILQIVCILCFLCLLLWHKWKRNERIVEEKKKRREKKKRKSEGKKERRKEKVAEKFFDYVNTQCFLNFNFVYISSCMLETSLNLIGTDQFGIIHILFSSFFIKNSKLKEFFNFVILFRTNCFLKFSFFVI